ncbi:junctional adhesion molecule 2 [Columba livia]|uniref:Junctional adhesion molecule 2 n=1 Tax=Columba livia TaxID=8932 RepID=A0A2I0MSI7_COLLI|nr:junctional adhesion molecule 2 [Columba livia]
MDGIRIVHAVFNPGPKLSGTGDAWWSSGEAKIYMVFLSKHACLVIGVQWKIHLWINTSLPDRRVSGISIETDNKNVKAEEFKEAILSCKHKFSKGMSLRIEWKKIQSQGVSFVYYNGEFTGDLQGRAEMLNTGIRIRNVTRKDSGTYRCEISAKSEEGQRLGEATITLTVLVAPTTPVCEVPSSAMTGTVVEMSCRETEGSPPSEYQWYKNGVALLEKTGTGSTRAANITYTMNKKSGTLLFNTVTKNDTGEYFCEASNGIGLSQKCSVKRMQVDDLNISGIIAAVVFVALVMALCGLGVFYAQKKGYFAKGSSSQKTNYQSTSEKASILHSVVCLKSFRCLQNSLDLFLHTLPNLICHQYLEIPSLCFCV